jgi:hypothetical protein
MFHQLHIVDAANRRVRTLLCKALGWLSGVKLMFRSHCRTTFATERGVVASSKMLPATDHQVAPEGGDEETHELGSTQGTDRCSSSQVQ